MLKKLIITTFFIINILIIVSGQSLTFTNIADQDVFLDAFTIHGTCTQTGYVDHIAARFNESEWIQLPGTDNWDLTVDYRKIPDRKEYFFNPVTGDFTIVQLFSVKYGELPIEVASFDEYNNIIDTTSVTVTIIPKKPTSDTTSDLYGDDVTFQLFTQPELSLYYTLDGQDPIEFGTQYTGALTVTESTLVKAVAVSDNNIYSEILDLTIDIDKTAAPTFTIAYFYDSTCLEPLGNNPYLKEGTYYLQIKANKPLFQAPLVSIDAQGTLNDVTDMHAIYEEAKTYVLPRTIIYDEAALGEIMETIMITGTDLLDQTSNQVHPLNMEQKAAYIDTIAPTTGTISITDIIGYTNDPTPLLTLSSEGAAFMRFALSEPALNNASWVAYNQNYAEFDISTTGEGLKHIWVEFKDQAGNIQTTHTSATTYYDNNGLILDITYYSDLEMTVPLDDTPYLKTGTYYLKLHSNKILTNPLSISIDAEGSNNDILDSPLTALNDYDYYIERTIVNDAAAVGLIQENISISGIDPSNENSKAAYIDTTIPQVNAGNDVNWTNTGVTVTAFCSDETPLTYLWTKQTGTGTILFENAFSNETLIEGIDGEEESFVIQLTVFDKAGNEATDTLTFNWDKKAPTVTVGSDIAWCNTQQTISAEYSDSNPVIDYTWQKITGTGDVVFSNPNATTTTVTGADNQSAEFTLQFSATDSAGNVGRDTLKFQWDKKAPVVDAGNYPDWTNTPVVLSPQITDSTETTVVWSQSGGNGILTFSDNTDVNATVSGGTDEEVTYEVQLTVTDAFGNVGTDSFTLQWDTIAPVVNAGSDINWTTYSEYLFGSADDGIGINSILWEKESGDGQITFSAASALTTRVWGTDGYEDEYVLKLTAVDYAGNSSSDTMIFRCDNKPPEIEIPELPWTNTGITPNPVATDKSGISQYQWQELNMDYTTSAEYLDITANFDTGSFNGFNWKNSGDSNWTVTNSNHYNGPYSIKSGTITHSQTSAIMFDYTLPKSSTIKFAVKVSSENSYDYLEFYIDGVKIDDWSGNIGWTNVTYPVTSGLHEFKWVYDKDGSVSDGSDCAWIDEVLLEDAYENVVTNYIHKVDISNESSRTPVLSGIGTYHDTVELQLRVWDYVGNSTITKVNFNWDNIPPEMPYLTGDDMIDGRFPTWTWGIPADTTGFCYQLNDGDWIDIDDAMIRSFTPVEPLAMGQYHVFNLKAKDHAGNLSPANTKTTGITITAPENITASSGENGRITLTWDAVDGAARYDIYRSMTDTTPDYTKVGDSVTPPYADTTVTPGTQYYYMVKSKGVSEIFSDYSNSTSGSSAIGSPEYVTATEGAYTNKIGLQWPSVISAEKYYIYRSTNADTDFVEIADVTGLSYDDTSITDYIHYFYRVKAWSTLNGYSDFSPPGEGYISLGIPQNVTASEGLSGKVTITWSSVVNAEKYYIYRSKTSGGTYTELTETTSTTHDDTTIEGGTYYYKVKAWSTAAGYSDFSSYDAGSKYQLPKPTGVSASKGTYQDKIRVTWNSVPQATHYYIYLVAGSSSYHAIGSTSSTTFDYTDIIPGVELDFAVRAWNITEQYSDYSVSSMGYKLLAPPVNVQATDGTVNGQIVLTWTNAPGVEDYLIFCSTSANGVYTEIINIRTIAEECPIDTDTSYANMLIESGKTYYFKIKSRTGSYPNYHDSGFSDIDSGYSAN